MEAKIVSPATINCIGAANSSPSATLLKALLVHTSLVVSHIRNDQQSNFTKLFADRVNTKVIS